MQNHYRRLLPAATISLCVVAGLAEPARALTFTEFPTPGPPSAITTGPDSALWFVERNQIGRITPAGIVSEFPIPTTNSSAVGITTGPDGALWFTEQSGNKIGRITTDGVITEFPLPTSGSGPVGITTGPDGALWFTESFTDVITTGPDGALWFTELNTGKVGRITTAGVITEFTIPTTPSVPQFITTGPDGALWYTEVFASESVPGRIGRITTAGVITEFPIPTPLTFADGITTGPDGALWFTEFTSGKIGRLALTTVNSHDFNANGKSDIAWRDSGGYMSMQPSDGTQGLPSSDDCSPAA